MIQYLDNGDKLNDFVIYDKSEFLSVHNDIIGQEYDDIKNEYFAEKLCNTIRKFAASQENIDNFESYLIHNYTKWVEKFAFTAEGFITEMESFANMELE